MRRLLGYIDTLAMLSHPLIIIAYIIPVLVLTPTCTPYFIGYMSPKEFVKSIISGSIILPFVTILAASIPFISITSRDRSIVLVQIPMSESKYLTLVYLLATFIVILGIVSEFIVGVLFEQDLQFLAKLLIIMTTCLLPTLYVQVSISSLVVALTRSTGTAPLWVLLLLYPIGLSVAYGMLHSLGYRYVAEVIANALIPGRKNCWLHSLCNEIY